MRRVAVHDLRHRADAAFGDARGEVALQFEPRRRKPRRACDAQRLEVETEEERPRGAVVVREVAATLVAFVAAAVARVAARERAHAERHDEFARDHGERVVPPALGNRVGAQRKREELVRADRRVVAFGAVDAIEEALRRGVPEPREA